MNGMTIFGALYSLGIVLRIIQLVIIVWVIYDVLTKQKRMPDFEKVLWIVLAFVLTFLGGLVYYLVIKREGKYEEEPEETTSKDVKVY